MSFIKYQVQCDKCGNIVDTAFGIIDKRPIARPVIQCNCGGTYKKLDGLKAKRLKTLEKLTQESQDMGEYDLSQCKSCLCMTYTVDGHCGKCKAKKEQA